MILKRGDSFVLGPEVRAEHPEAAEYAVKMRRLREDRMLDAMLTAGRVDSAMIRAIAARIAEFHAAAPSEHAWTCGSAAAIWRSVIDDIAQDEAFIGLTQRDFQFNAIETFCRNFITAHWRQLNAVRRRAGLLRVRVCPGRTAGRLLDFPPNAQRGSCCSPANESRSHPRVTSLVRKRPVR